MNTKKTGSTILATALVLALIGTACSDDPDDSPAAATTTPSDATTTTVAPASGVKTIEPDALQALVDETAEELLVPGAVVLLRTSQGEFTAAFGTTELGVENRPSAPIPTSGSPRSPRR